MTDLPLKGYHALVCGASSGLGRATALSIARDGAWVTVLARSEDKLQTLKEELEVAGAPDAAYLVVDMEDHEALQREVEKLASEHPVHILVNNSGGPPAGPILEASPEDFTKAFRRHILAAHLLLGVCLPGMKEAGYGRIVNIISSSVKEPIPGLGVSNTTRGAMASWSKTVSQELPAGITINNVLPGYIATDRLAYLADVIAEKRGTSADAVRETWVGNTFEGRLGRPEEIGDTIAFLVSPRASYIRGQSLAVDGGRMKGI